MARNLVSFLVALKCNAQYLQPFAGPSQNDFQHPLRNKHYGEPSEVPLCKTKARDSLQALPVRVTARRLLTAERFLASRYIKLQFLLLGFLCKVCKVQ